MKHLQPIIILILLTVSCQNQTTNKSAQKQNADTSKEDKATTAIKTIEPELSNENFFNFWKDFRTAILDFDTSQIIAQTEFPFLTRGSLDSDPTIEYNKKKFVRVFTAFLTQWNGLEMEGGSELDIIKKTEVPKKDDVQNDYARIGDLVFNKQDNSWKLVFVYLNDETIESLKNK